MKRMARIGLVLGVALAFLATGAIAADPKTAAKPAAKTDVKAAEKKVPAKKAELIDINTATKDQLRTIEGIGDVYAQKIIDGRPYAKKDQLKSRKILPEAVYNKVKDRIIAKQAPKAKK